MDNIECWNAKLRMFFCPRFFVVFRKEEGWWWCATGGQGGHSGQVDSCQVVFYTRCPELCDETSRIESFLILNTHRLVVDGSDAKI